MSFLGLPPGACSKVLLSAMILGGAALCFFGFRLFRVALGAAGLVCGAAVASYLAWRYTATPETLQMVETFQDVLDAMAAAPNRTTLLVAAAAGGVAGAVVSVLMHQVGVFLLGASLGALLASQTMARADAQAYLIVLAILSVIGGVLGLLLRKPIVVISTALNGAGAFMLGVYALLQRYSFEEALLKVHHLGSDAYVLLGCTLLLAAVGGYVQFATLPRKKVLYARVKPEKKGASG